METPLVSVLFITYNHEKFVRQALESILMQKTNFPFNIIIGDDCSKDGTRAIIAEIANKNQDKIILSNPEKNLGPALNFIQLFYTCANSDCKYIAYLEGDDYWTDPYKLQKQADFLGANNDFVMCFGKTELKYERVSKYRYFNEMKKDVFSFRDILFNHYIPSNTLMFKNIIKVFPDWYKNVSAGDIALELLLAKEGKTKFLNEDFALYRINNGSKTSKPFVKNHDEKIFFYKYLAKEVNFKQKFFVYILVCRYILGKYYSKN